MAAIFNRCLSCGSRAKAICPQCWRVLSEGAESRDLIIIAEKPFVQRALFRWDDRETHKAEILRSVILSAKETPSRALVDLWVHEFLRRGSVGSHWSKMANWIVTCPPGRSGHSEPDHAGAMARGLAQHTLVQFDGSLVKTRKSARSQKSKSRAERAEIEFGRISNGHVNREPAPINGGLFMDDVIATGSTALAAWRAFGQPEKFEAWAVAWKVREC